MLIEFVICKRNWPVVQAFNEVGRGGLTLKKAVLVTNNEVMFKKVVGKLIGDNRFAHTHGCMYTWEKFDDNWMVLENIAWWYYVVLYCIVLHCIVLYCTILCRRVVSYRMSYRIVSRIGVSYRIAHRIASHRNASHRIASYRTVSYRIIVSYRIVPYRIESYRIVSYRIVSYPIVSYRIVSYSKKRLRMRVPKNEISNKSDNCGVLIIYPTFCNFKIWNIFLIVASMCFLFIIQFYHILSQAVPRWCYINFMNQICNLQYLMRQAQSCPQVLFFDQTRPDLAKLCPDPTHDYRQKVWPDPTRPAVQSMFE